MATTAAIRSGESPVKHILMVETSPRGKASASRAVADALATRPAELYPSATLQRRDLAAMPLPHLDAATLQAISTRDASEADGLHALAGQSDRLTDELLRTDLLVIATPMWNFGIPSSLKAWIAWWSGPAGRSAMRRMAWSGWRRASAPSWSWRREAFSPKVRAPWDFVEPYLRRILSFIGIADVRTVRAEGMNIPALTAQAVPEAMAVVAALAP